MPVLKKEQVLINCVRRRKSRESYGGQILTVKVDVFLEINRDQCTEYR